MPTADKKKKPGSRPAKKASKVKINSANQNKTRPGPKNRGRERGVKGARGTKQA